MRNLLILFALFSFFSLSAQTRDQSTGFMENRGQIVDQKGRPNPKVRYLLNTNGLNVQLRENGFSYDIYEVKKHPLAKSRKKDLGQSSFTKKDTLNYPNYTLECIYHRIDIDFENSNTGARLIAGGKSTDFDNYYTIKGVPDGITNVHRFQKVTYKNIYDNIDVVFFIPDDKSKPVEYNFIVNPGGRLADIQLRFNGAKTELAGNRIRMDVRFGQMEETLPLSWTENGTDRTEIGIAYKKIKTNVYGFEGSISLAGKKIVIDPTPTRLWGTFYGDQAGNHYSIDPINVTTDSFGNAYMTGGTTASNSTYATTGAHQVSIPPYIYVSSDGIIVKFDANGNRLWGTYYGGTSYNRITGIKTDSQNNVLISGLTKSPINISTPGSYKPDLAGDSDAFLVKFNGSGARLWGTYFGGENDDSAYALDIDNSDNIYIVGMAGSNTGIAINSNFQTQFGQGYSDGFLAKFNAAGNLIWGTYAGGENQEELRAIKVKDNYLVAGGSTNSFNNIATLGVFQQTHDLTNHADGVVYKFSLDGQRIWATYYGGEQVDYVYTVEIDDEDNIYLGGQTASDGNMTTPGSFEDSNPYLYLYRGFFAKLGSNGARLWGSYLSEAKVHSLVFRNNSIYIGATNNLSFGATLTTPCSYRPNGNFEGYLGKFSKQGEYLWGSFVGGNSNIGGFFDSNATKIALDNNNDIFVAGITTDNNGIADSNSYQPAVLGLENYYLMKFSEGPLCSLNIQPASNSPVCIASTLSFSNIPAGYHYSWTGPNGFTSSGQNPAISNAGTSNSGLYTLVIDDGIACGCEKTYNFNVIVGDPSKPVPDATPLPVVTGGCNTTVAIPTATDKCAGTITATTTDPLNYSLPGSYTIHWNYDDGNGNIATQEQTVTISAVALPVMASPQVFCIQQNAKLGSIALTGQNIRWYDAATGGNLLAPTASLVDGTTYYASQTVSGCESLRVPVLVTIQDTPAPSGMATQIFCSAQNAALNDIVVTGSNMAWYDSLSATIAIPGTTLLVGGKTYYASQAVNGCESRNRLAVTVTLASVPNAGDYSATICDDLNDGSEIIDLTAYNGNLVSTASNYTFEYYSSLSGAINQGSTELIAPATRYNLATGLHSIYVRITLGAGCSKIVRLDLTLADKLVIAIGDTVPICEKGDVTVDASIGFDSYLWSTGSALHAVTLSQPGNYSVTVTKRNGAVICSSTKNFTVVLSKAATITSIETSDWTDTENVIAVNTNPGNYEFSIDGVNYQPGNVFQGLQGGLYTVYVHDINGCGITKENIFLLMYPKFFTPNGDGHNDTWGINFSYLEPGLKAIIFDRYGKVLKELVDKDSWDGRYNGYGLPSDDYWFVVTRGDGKQYRGHFALKR